MLPIVDYCTYIWNPYKSADINKVESVQRFFTKRLAGLWDIAYSERLKLCELTTLELRRLHFDIILCFRIVHKLTCLNFTDFFTFDPNSVTRGHNLKLCYPLCKTTCRLNAFAVRVVPIWNCLTVELVNSQTLAIFKSGIKKFNFNKFLDNKFDYI